MKVRAALVTLFLVVLMAGEDTQGHPAGTNPGDVIHVFESSGIQINTDVQIDPAGNVWSANNWNVVEAAIVDDSVRGAWLCYNQSETGGRNRTTIPTSCAAPATQCTSNGRAAP